MRRLFTFGRLAIDGDERPIAEVRPRRLALLALLAAAGPRGIARDRVLAILWTDSEPERARHSLAQALYSLRRDLGEDVVLSGANLRLDAEKIGSDVGDFRAAIAGREWDQAAALFAGPFLDGFYLSDVPDFERWVTEERAVLSKEAVHAIEQSAHRARDERRFDDAARALHHLTRIEPLSGRYAAEYMDALATSGDRAAALAHGQAHRELVRRELEVDADADVVRRIDELRASSPPTTPAQPPPARRRKSLEIAYAVALDALNASRRRTLIAVAALLLVVAYLIPAGVRATRGATTAGRAPTHSALAQRLLDDGVLALFELDYPRASRLFDEALREDSTFALAAYNRWRVEEAMDGPREDSLADRAIALAERSTERDRLLIQTHVWSSRSDLRAIPVAESLGARFPSDPEALIRVAEVEGDFSRAVARLQRAILLDSAAGFSATRACRACEALAGLVSRYDWADSTEAVQRTLSRWSAMRPADFQPWQRLADEMVSLGRAREADQALHRADSLGAPRRSLIMDTLTRSLRADDLETANRLCANPLTGLDAASFISFRSTCTIALRTQGRYRDAIGLVRGGRFPGARVGRTDLPRDSLHEAILDMEMARPAAAAMQFEAMARDAARSSQPDGAKARLMAWRLTLSGTALALYTDTIRMRALADSVDLIGHRSLSLTEPLLHHFLRGVLLASGNHHEAAVRELRASIASPTRGYARANYELAQSLLALRRPTEAIPVLRATLRGGIDGPGLYLTRTEAHELLARAFADAGQLDSATSHYVAVERAWRAADPVFAQRYAVARDWLAQHRR